MIASVVPPLPRWDLSNVFASLDGQDYQATFLELDTRISALNRFFDSSVPDFGKSGIADDVLAHTLAESLRHANDIAMRYETLEAFVYSFYSTNSFDPVAARETSKLEGLDTTRQKLNVRLRTWIGALASRLENVIPGEELLREHAFFLAHTAKQSRYLMPEELEGLAAELCVDGGNAFSKLQGNITSQLQVPWETDGETKLTPITVIRNFSYDRDESVRKKAYEVERQGWASIRTTVAACLNGVKGTALTLAKRRGRSVLDAALEDNRIDRDTLEAMLGSIRESIPMFRRYLKAKAAKLGKQQLAWWDLFAPVGATQRTFTWPDARRFIIDKFSHFSDDLGQFAQRSFDENWIDAEPRAGKRGGAFCMAVPGVEESRVLMNFDGSFEQVSTLAHELGHAYHNECQRGLPALRRGAPSTLAETASIFCETLIAEASLAEAKTDERTMILELQLANAAQVCLDISSRYLFESAFVKERADAELNPDEICALMKKAQSETYGDAVDPSTYHPYMWLWKPHYYQHAANFYNFPYAFGHLFGLGLFAIYQQEGRAFVQRYRELLRDTGQSYAAPLAARFGIDITQPDFWRNSLKIVAGQLERYEQ